MKQLLGGRSEIGHAMRAKKVVPALRLQHAHVLVRHVAESAHRIAESSGLYMYNLNI